MNRRFQFSSRRLLLVTAVLAVWVAVFATVAPRLRGGNSVPPLFEWAAVVCFFVIPTLLLVGLAAVIVRTLGRKSNLAACCGAVVYVAFIAYVSWVTWG